MDGFKARVVALALAAALPMAAGCTFRSDEPGPPDLPVEAVIAALARDDGEPAAEVAMEVIQQVGRYGAKYHAHLRPATRDLIIDLAIVWLDVFGHPAVAGISTVDRFPDPITGDTAVGIHLSAPDRARFLEFVAGADQASVVRFRAASIGYSHALLVEALQRGGPSQQGVVLEHLGNLDGVLSMADYRYVRAEWDHGSAWAATVAEWRRHCGMLVASEVARQTLAQGVGRVANLARYLSSDLPAATTATIEAVRHGPAAVRCGVAVGDPPDDFDPRFSPFAEQRYQRDYLLVWAYGDADLLDAADRNLTLLHEESGLVPYDALFTGGDARSKLHALRQTQRTVAEALDLLIGVYDDARRDAYPVLGESGR